MKILYAAKMGRYDLIRPVTALATRVTKCSSLCDKKLYKLVSYINSTLDTYLYGYIGDSPMSLELVLYCDADLAGDRTDSKSTSGVFMCLQGPRSFFPLAAVSKKQTSVATSTPEAEMVAMAYGLSKEALAIQTLWQAIMGRKFTIRLMEDNAAASRIVITGRNPSMKHMVKTQRVSVS